MFAGVAVDAVDVPRAYERKTSQVARDRSRLHPLGAKNISDDESGRRPETSPHRTEGEQPMKHDEAEFQGAVIELCASRDLHPVVVNPERFSQRVADNKGFPDLTIYGPGGVLYRELKTEAGMQPGNGLRPDQTTWKYRLMALGMDWAIWTPKDLASGLIESELSSIETRGEAAKA
jgi:hypothetical protein